MKLNQLKLVSKRTVTFGPAKLFDPFGLLAPVVIKTKIFIQKEWQLGLDWDDLFPEDFNAT